jgi:predicted nucleic acid-binding protein
MDSRAPVVVDTDVISFLFKSHSLALAYQDILAGRSLAISLITVAEIEFGMEAKNWGANRRELMRRFLARFTALLPNTETARIWAWIKFGCEKKGRPITFADAWIAAAAVQMNVALVTHNARDYAAVENLKVLTASVTAG